MAQPPPYAPLGTDPAVGVPYPSASAPPAPPPAGPAYYAPNAPAPVQSHAGGGGYAMGAPPPAGFQPLPNASAPGYPKGPVVMQQAGPLPYAQQAPSTRLSLHSSYFIVSL